MSILKRHIPTTDLLGEYLTFSPTPKQVASFEADMRTLNPTLLRDAIKEAKATRNMAGMAHDEQRRIVHKIYTRKVKELASLFPVLFALENGLRSTLADYLGTYFGRMDWWVVVRNAVVAGQGHANFNSICGKPVSRGFIKQAFFTIEKLLDGQHANKLHGADRSDEFYYVLTIGELTRLMAADWTLCRSVFRDDAAIGLKLDLQTFQNNVRLVRDARNEIYHSNPISGRKGVFEASERLLNALDFHLGDYDSDLRDAQYKRIASTIIRSDRHLIPAR